MSSAIIISLLTVACKTSTNATAASESEVKISNSALPKAIIYKVEPDFIDKVPVTMDAGKSRMISYPDVLDVSESTSPVPLRNGYLLDRQGIGVNTMFLLWNRNEYASFTSTPKPSAIREAIIPTSYVREIVILPISLTDALKDTTVVNDIIMNGLENCKVLHGRAIQFGDPPVVIGTLY